MQELQYLNLAVNNITKVQNLQRCESLQKLDLTVNFVNKAGLLSISSLADNYNLQELFLIGNPCTEWPGYRHYVIAKLPQLQKLDGQEIKKSERIAARQSITALDSQLHSELLAEGIDPATAGCVEDDSLYNEGADIPETGYVDEDGQLKRPWCPATRILEHRETEKANKEAEEKKAAAAKEDPFAPPPEPLRHETFPEVKEGDRFMQRNEGKWDFTLQESDDRLSIVLDVAVGKYLDTSLIQADVQPKYVRLLIKGRLLQLLLPVEVKPDSSVAQRSTTTGHLVITMPKECSSDRVVDVACMRPGPTSTTSEHATTTRVSGLKGNLPNNSRQPLQPNQQPANIYNMVKTTRAGSGDDFLIKEIRRAAVTAAAVADDDDDDDDIPSLT
eukprot:jgi/Chrzof1/9782/Cz04g15170.t1